MSDRFTYTDRYTKNFGIMAGIGILLLVAGFFISNIGGEHEAGGGSHWKPGDSTSTTNPDKHGAINHDKTILLASNQDGAVHGGATEEHPAAATDAAHGKPGESHNAGHGAHEAHDPYDTHAPNGTLIRAPLHEGQFTPHHEHGAPGALAKIGAVFLMAAFWFTGIAVFGVFFQAFSTVANAGWYVAFRRVPEVFYRFIPVGVILLLVVFVLRDHVYSHWSPIAIMTEGSPVYDPLIAGKSGFLNWKWLLGTMILFPALWTFFGHKIRSNSLMEDKEGGLAAFSRNRILSAAFLPIFAITFCLAAFLWLMSLEPHWFSTIYAVYCFSAIFVSGIIFIMLIVVHLKEKGLLPNVTGEHLHDLGKLMFAFSIFWAYIWISQFLLIWYANIPEETQWYYDRFQNYNGLFYLSLVLNFVFPFLALMTRNAKRQYSSLKTIGVIMLFGRFLDIFILVMPGVMGAHWNFGVLVMALGMFLVVGAVFLFIIFKSLATSPLVAVNNPYYEESAHHSTGV